MTTIAIAKNTFWEVLKSPLFVVLGIVGIVAVVLLGMIPYFTLVLEDDVKMFKDVATAMTLFVGLLLAVLSATKVIDEEIDNKTMLTLLSKPVRRGEIVLGKFLGVCASVAVVVFPSFSRQTPTPKRRRQVLWITFAMIPISAVLSPIGTQFLLPIMTYSFPKEVVPSADLVSWTMFANFALASIHLLMTWHVAQRTRRMLEIMGLCSALLIILLLSGQATDLYIIQVTSVSVWLGAVSLALLAYFQTNTE